MSPLTESEQQGLLRLARQALEESVRGQGLPQVEGQALEGRLAEPGAAFVSLHKGGRLRGCIGYVQALMPLYQTVCECAKNAALHDPRFDPVDPEELSQLDLEISVLSPMQEIQPEQVEVGRHGLLVSRGSQRGLLLPQVAVEFRWDRATFLGETCLKAGLPFEAWKHGARIHAFTAQVFGESRSAPRSSHHAA
jgi:AmmeMemoRadiSam system protein A